IPIRTNTPPIVSLRRMRTGRGGSSVGSRFGTHLRSHGSDYNGARPLGFHPSATEFSLIVALTPEASNERRPSSPIHSSRAQVKGFKHAGAELEDWCYDTSNSAGSRTPRYAGAV